MKNHFHIDHVFPKARFTEKRLAKAGVPVEKLSIYCEQVNGIANLQLLEGPKNLEKQQSLPSDWLMQAFDTDEARKSYCDRHLLGNIPTELLGFGDFFQSRRGQLRNRIVQLLSEGQAPNSAVD